MNLMSERALQSVGVSLGRLRCYNVFVHLPRHAFGPFCLHNWTNGLTDVFKCSWTGPGRSHVRYEPLGWKGSKLCSHVGYPQPDFVDRKPAAAPAGRVRFVSVEICSIEKFPLFVSVPVKRRVCHSVCDVEGELHATACYPSSCTSDMLLSYKHPDLQYSMEQAGV